MGIAVIGVVADDPSGRDSKELRVLPSLLGGDVGGDERCEHLGHALLLCVDDLV
jgi:hypothetical protein